MIERPIKNLFYESIMDTPVVLIQGPRQVGKTTFVMNSMSDEWEYASLDDKKVRELARTDPIGFIQNRDRVIIDEVHLVPDLFPEIKRSVDEDRRPGRFILTGSANVLLVPKISESLAGRIEIIDMLPLSQSEINGRNSTFLEGLFAGKLNQKPEIATLDNLVEIIVTGGYPESINRNNERGRLRWANSYLKTTISRDLRELSDISKLVDLTAFIKCLALHSGQLVNFTQFGNSVNVNYKTGQHYLALLEQLYFTTRLRPWHSNNLSKLIKSPKLHFLDSGLLTAARGLNSKILMQNRMELGAVMESFVFSEVLKLLKVSDQNMEPYFFRGPNSKKVDIVLQRDDGKIAGIEVKASATVAYKDFAGLRMLEDICGDKFAFGVVLNCGTKVKPYGKRMAIAPIPSLWS